MDDHPIHHLPQRIERVAHVFDLTDTLGGKVGLRIAEAVDALAEMPRLLIGVEARGVVELDDTLADVEWLADDHDAVGWVSLCSDRSDAVQLRRVLHDFRYAGLLRRAIRFGPNRNDPPIVFIRFVCDAPHQGSGQQQRQETAGLAKRHGRASLYGANGCSCIRQGDAEP